MIVTLRPLTHETLRECLALKITEEQKWNSQIGEPSEKIVEICKNPATVPLAIYGADVMVGFAAYSRLDEPSDFHIPLFFIDVQHQRKGYGETALRQLVELLFAKDECHRIVINYMSFADGPSELYAKVGFIETPEFQEAEEFDQEHGEKYAVLTRGQFAI